MGGVKEVFNMTRSFGKTAMTKGAFLGRPSQLLEFVGRETAIANVTEMLRRPGTRLLTLYGDGGVGKTELALRVADEVVKELDHGGVFVTLDNVKRADQILYEVGKVLSVPEGGGPVKTTTVSPPTYDDVVLGHLKGKRCLLVLDNLEQIEEVDQDTLGQVLLHLTEGTSDTNPLKILATSRWEIGLHGASSYRVPLLYVPDDLDNPPSFEELRQYDAVSIFVSTAERRDPSFGGNLTTERAVLILKLCKALDQLPLLLTHAASYLGDYTLEQMVLDPNRFAHVRHSSLKLPERHNSASSSSGWSYNIIGADRQKLFRRLSVFQGSWTLEAAEPICSAGGGPPFSDIEQLMLELADKQLIRIHKEVTDGYGTSYKMLPLMREFAASELNDISNSDDKEAIMNTYGNYYLALAVEAESAVTGSKQGEWLSKVEQEEDNLWAALTRFIQLGQKENALQLAGHLWRFWLIRARFTKGTQWIEESLSRSTPGEPTPGRAVALLGAGVLEIERYNYIVALSRLEESERIYRSLDQKRGIAYALTFQASIAWKRADKERCLDLLGKSQELFTTEFDDWGLGLALCYMAMVYEGTDEEFVKRARTGEPDIARSFYERSVSLFATVGDRWGQAIGNVGLANIAYRGGDRLTARTLYLSAVKMLRDIKAMGLACQPLTSLGNIELVDGNFAEAEAYHSEALPHHRLFGNTYSLAYSANGLGEVARSRGQYNEALPFYMQAVEAQEEALGSGKEKALREKGMLQGHAWTLCNTGVAYLHVDPDKPDSAERYFRESLTVFRDLGFDKGNLPGIMLCLAGLAVVANRRKRSGDLERAATLLGVADKHLVSRQGTDPPVKLEPVDAQDFKKLSEEVFRVRKGSEWEKGWAKGRRMNPEQAVKYVLEGENPEHPFGLTGREMEVALLIAKGLDDQAIADRLGGIKVSTVTTHRRNILQKVGVSSTRELIVELHKAGIE
jgi:predicted ATPase/DNA-binding CsgD family transcriptional regulator